MKNPFKKRFHKWVDRRIPPAHEINLGQRQLFIFASRAGWMYLTILILMLVGATNYQNSLGFVLSFLLLAIGLLAIIKTFNNISGLTLSGLSSPAVFAGEMAKFQITAMNLNGSESIGFGFKGTTQVWLDFPPQKSISFELQTETSIRGWHQAPRIYLHSEFPLGLLRCWSWIDLQQQVLVFPKPEKPPHLNDYLNGEIDPQKGLLQPGDDYDQSRRYQKGDSPRHIDWKVFARTDKLFTKKFEQPMGKEIWLDLEIFAEYELEKRLNFLSYLVIEAELSNQPYGLKLGNLSIGPDQGDKHRHHCLAALAAYGVSPHMEDEHKESRKFWFRWFRLLFSKQPGVLKDEK